MNADHREAVPGLGRLGMVVVPSLGPAGYNPASPTRFDDHPTCPRANARRGKRWDGRKTAFWRVSEWLAATLEMSCRETGCGFDSRALRFVIDGP